MNLEGKIFFITGGTGSFGSTVCNFLLNKGVKEVRIFSRDENKQYKMRKEINDSRVNFLIPKFKIYNWRC